MAAWMVWAGGKGEQEQAALQGDFVTIHWIELPDLSSIRDKAKLRTRYKEACPTKINRGKWPLESVRFGRSEVDRNRKPDRLASP